METKRRTPRQERSKATREAIVEAAARVFSEVGLERATTARIAEVAGVSPGSMYQYFPSKEALVTALFEREVEEQTQAFLAIAQEHGTGDVPMLIRTLVEWAIDDILKKRALARVLVEEVPRLAGLDPSRHVDLLAAKSLRTLLELARPVAQPRDLDVASVLVVRAFRYGIIGALLDGPLEGARRSAFVDELTDLLATYILSPRPWRP